MKALFSRMRHGGKPPSRDKDLATNSRDKDHPPLPLHDDSHVSAPPSERSLVTDAMDDESTSFGPPLHPIPSTSQGSSTRSSDHAASSVDTHGTPVRSRREVDLPPIPSALDPTTSKKVAFVSPPPTPAAQLSAPLDSPPVSANSRHAPEYQSYHPPNTPSQPRRTTDTQRSTPSTTSKSPTLVDVQKASGYPASAKMRSSPIQSVTPRPYAASAILQDAYSVRSGSPLSHMSGRTGIQAAASWSEAAEEDLVSNLGPRERTRQEVLWEIVASEDRLVNFLSGGDCVITSLLDMSSSCSS